MPTYVYRRSDGATFEVRQPITEAALTECPETGLPCERVVVATAPPVLRGGGWAASGYDKAAR